ncbi:MAG TPA: hypothetical protein P5277_01570 [Candidatus Paceibacterota bacterium]|nr:hypothetical protein [Candidatus Paceibacterota bacterium]
MERVKLPELIQVEGQIENISLISVFNTFIGKSYKISFKKIDKNQEYSIVCTGEDFAVLRTGNENSSESYEFLHPIGTKYIYAIFKR